MNTPKEFLESVLPAGGKYFLFGIKQGDGEASNTVRQIGIETIDELLEKSAGFVEKGFDAFFALASFKTTKSRIVANINELKSYYLDIDCGEGKPYANAVEGMKALRQYCKQVGMPKPTVVSSGRGLHAYWPFTEAVSYIDWIPHAEAFKKSCIAHKFDIDLSVPADGARVLRIPGTMHLKDPNNPLPVAIVTQGEPSAFSVFKELFPADSGGLAIAGKRLNYGALDETTKRTMGNMEHSFKRIMQRSMKGEGCNQLKHIFENQESISYDMWRAGLSIANKCTDREIAIVKMSEKHPGYNYNTAMTKAADTTPHRCSTFKELNPMGCEGCKHKITTPLHLDSAVIEATAEDNIIVSIDKETKEQVTYTIPPYPFPFARGKLGGVYKKGDEDEPDILVYAHDFYATQRIKDPELGHTIVFKLHSPKDGVIEFAAPLASIMSRDKFRDTLAHHGMAVLPKQVDLLMSYAAKWVEQMQTTNELEHARTQFGWTPDNDAIIIGSDEVRATEIRHSPPTTQTLAFIPTYQTKGSFDVWKDVVNVYGKAGMEPRAFAFFLGFGSLLVRHTKVEGFVLHLMSNASGSGKSTILHAIASIYGNPKPQIVNAKDTQNSKMQIMGTLHNFPALFDEITNMPPLEKSDVVYQATQGRAKHKAKAQESGIRVNTTSWETALISTGNSSLVDDLLSLKAIPDGELNRLLEFYIEKDEDADPTWSRTHFGKLYDNYGHAIRPFAQYLVANLEAVKDLMEQVQQRIEKLADAQPSERFWLVMASVAITAGIISRRLGLHDIDHVPVMHFIVDHIKASRVSVKKYIADPAESISAYLYSHLDEMVIANGIKDKRTSLDSQAIREPRGKVMSIRYEPDTKALYVSTAAYRQYCQKLQIGFDESLRPHKKSNALISDENKKRLGAGTSFSAMNGIAVLHFDATKLPNFDEKALEDAISTGSADRDTVV
jgi:hypothetical protein